MNYKTRAMASSVAIAMSSGSGAMAQSTAAPPIATGTDTTATTAGANPVGQDASEAANSTGLTDIVVTATRRATNVQDTPLAITAVSGDALQNRGIADPSQLSRVAPNLLVDQGYSNGSTHISIRGLASTDNSLGATSPVAIYLDDVFQPFQYGLGTQVYDVSRIEVLRGPQGTLFGKNTTGGAVNYYSQEPTQEREGYLLLDGSGGYYDRFSVEGAFNQPVSATLSTRASFKVDKRQDYVDNLFLGDRIGQYRNYNGRFQVLWRPSSTTRVNLKLFGTRNVGDDPVYFGQYYANPCGTAVDVYFSCAASGNPAPQTDNIRQVNREVQGYENYDNYGATLKVDQDIGEWHLTSISAAQKGSYDILTNEDGLAADLFHSVQRSKSWLASQELRLASPTTAPLKAVVGLYGMYDNISTRQASGSTAFGPPFDYTLSTQAGQDTVTLAAFGSVTYDITERLSVTGGLRYSNEHKKAYNDLIAINNGEVDFDDGNFDLDPRNPGVPFDPALGDILEFTRRNDTWRRLTWDATVNYKPTRDILLYAKAATGFRSGGYNLGTTIPNAFDTLRPEVIRSYEGGFKTEWLDRHLRVNGSAYFSRYSDLQVQTINSNGPGVRIANAASAHIKGAEIEIEAIPVENLTIGLSGGYNDAKYQDFVTLQFGNPVNLKGNRLPYAPLWTVSPNASYSVPLGDHKLTLFTDWFYRSRVFFDPNNFREVSDPGRFTGNVSVQLASGTAGWSITAYVNNVTDVQYRSFNYYLANEGAILYTANQYAPTRTYGARVRFNF